MTPDRRISWIINGELTHVLPETPGLPMSEMDLLSRKGAIKIVESSQGIEIKWVLFSANWASLYYLIESIHLYAGPFKFRYFLSGWFTEEIKSIVEAKLRLQELMAKSDVHVSQHAFVKQFDPNVTRVPHVLRDTLSDLTAMPDLSVDCVFDEDTEQFLVMRVGSQSGIAKLFGVSPVSVPCLTGNSYDQVISDAYKKVLVEEVPHYDHVIAAMVLPDKSVNWIPYQRVVLPHRFPDGKKGVCVVSDLVNVDIKIV